MKKKTLSKGIYHLMFSIKILIHNLAKIKIIKINEIELNKSKKQNKKKGTLKRDF